MPKKLTLEALNKKLDLVLKNQQRLLKGEKRIEKEEVKEEKEEEAALAELQKLETLEKEIIQEVEQHPLQKITYKDIARGAIGAFFGSVAHYTFIYGIKVAEAITVGRATLLLPISFIIGAIFLYATGFRKIKDPKIMWFLPVRLFVLYITAIIVSILVLYLFTPSFGMAFVESYKQVATVSLSAIIGACTADILGKD